MPFFSIIVPVYNVEKYLKQCVESVLVQSYDNYELILIDDGSPDHCPEMCDIFAQSDKRLKVVHKENAGLSSARNVGLDIAKGEYVIFLDSDDFWDDENALFEISEVLHQNPVDILITGKKKYYQHSGIITDVCVPSWNEKKQYASYDDKISYLMKNNIFVATACDKVVRKELIDDGNLRFVVGQLSEDIEWCIRLLQCKPSIELLDKPFYVYRKQNKASISSNIGRKNLVDISKVIRTYMPSRTDVSDVATYLKHYLAVEYVLWLAITVMLPTKDIKDLLSDMHELWHLLDYNWYPYVKKVNYVRWLGFHVTRRLLGAYLKIKRGLTDASFDFVKRSLAR